MKENLITLNWALYLAVFLLVGLVFYLWVQLHQNVVLCLAIVEQYESTQ